MQTRDLVPPHLRGAGERERWETCQAKNCTTWVRDAPYCSSHKDIARLARFAEAEDVDLVFGPGGQALHVEGCDRLPGDKDRWRDRDEGPGERYKTAVACSVCLTREARHRLEPFTKKGGGDE